MADFILTWNPSKWTMPDEEFDEAVETTRRGGEYKERWSVGVRVGGIELGDHAYLLRQHQDRGIVAAGLFVSSVYQSDHWDGSDRDANYADVAWTTWLAVDERIPTEILKSRVEVVAWDRIEASGVKISQDAAFALDTLWAEHLTQIGREPQRAPDEVAPYASYHEGSVSRVEVNRYERDPRARAACIGHYGVNCLVCGFNFEKVYGALGRGFVNVHHVVELSALPAGYLVDPITDLIPVCANCHAMLHRTTPALTPAELRAMLA